MKSIRVLIMKEPKGDSSTLVAQALEYDIAVQGDTLDDVTQCMDSTLRKMISIAAERNEKPFERLKPAPAMYWRKWNTRTGYDAEACKTGHSDFAEGGDAPSLVLATA